MFFTCICMYPKRWRSSLHARTQNHGGGSNIFMCAPRHSGEYFVTVFISLYSGTYGVLCELNMHRMYVRHISLYVYQ